MQNAAEQARQKAQLDSFPVGTAVMVRGATMGLGIVREHITEHRFSDGRVIPFIGFAEALVVFFDDFGESPVKLKMRELYKPTQAKAIQGTWRNIRHLRNAAEQASKTYIAAICDEAERFGAGSRAYTMLCDHMTTGAPLPESATQAYQKAADH